nr:S-layer homology domain-containing protein [Desulforamulus aquiferis]
MDARIYVMIKYNFKEDSKKIKYVLFFENKKGGRHVSISKLYSRIRSVSIVMSLLLLLNIFSFSITKQVQAEEVGQVIPTEQRGGDTEATSVQQAVYQDDNLDSIDLNQETDNSTGGDPSIEEGTYMETVEETLTEVIEEEEIATYSVIGYIYGITEEDSVKVMLNKGTGEMVVSQDFEIGQVDFSFSNVPAGEYTLCVLINGATAVMKPIKVEDDIRVEDIHVARVFGTIIGLPEGVIASVFLKPENKDIKVMPLRVISNGDITEFTYKVMPGFYHMTIKANDFEDYIAPDVIEVGEGGVILEPIEMVFKLEILTTSLPNGAEGTTYSTELNATGGKVPLSWAITWGTLPEGLTLDTMTGVISGIPAISGDYSFIVTVTDTLGHTYSQTLNLSISSRSTGGSSGGGSGSSGINTGETNASTINTTFTDQQIKEAINLSQGTVTLFAPSGKYSLNITGEQYKLLVDSGKDMVVSMQDVNITLNPGSINLLEGDSLEFRVEGLSDVTAKELVSQSNYQLIGSIFEITVEIKSDEITQKNPLNQSVRVSLPVKSDIWLGESHNWLDVFFYNESDSNWESMQAIHNIDSQELIFITPHFSKYAVLKKPERKFTDVKGHWGEKDIELMAARGIISGYNDDSFRPNANITRAELAILLSRLLGLNEKAINTFNDVSEKDWYYESIAKAFHAGIVSGYDGGYFKPNQYVNREQMAAMISNTIENMGISLGQNDASMELFFDAGSISLWARQSVATTSAMGIVKGIISEEKIKFEPNKNATRAEATVMLARLLDIAEKAKHNL